MWCPWPAPLGIGVPFSTHFWSVQAERRIHEQKRHKLGPTNIFTWSLDLYENSDVRHGVN